MYDSLKPWINLPVTIHPFIKRTGTGSKLFGDDVSATCYAQGETVSVKNADGEEVTSSTQLYFDGNVTINILDRVTFYGVSYDIQSIAAFYRDGRLDIKVVYL